MNDCPGRLLLILYYFAGVKYHSGIFVFGVFRDYREHNYHL